MTTLYAATSNPGKLREFAQTAASQGIDILPLPGLADMPEPVEDAPDFLGNAVLKARAYSLLAPGLHVLADDSGLEVDALGGRPGVRSARFADDHNFLPGGEISQAKRNNLCLLAHLRHVELEGAAPSTRTARFRCALALARDGEILLRAEGLCEGEILPDAEPPRGENGFGYDPLFLFPRLHRTLAELGPEEKWQVGHRGEAFRALLLQLRADGLQRDRNIAQAGR